MTVPDARHDTNWSLNVGCVYQVNYQTSAGTILKSFPPYGHLNVRTPLLALLDRCPLVLTKRDTFSQHDSHAPQNATICILSHCGFIKRVKRPSSVMLNSLSRSLQYKLTGIISHLTSFINSAGYNRDQRSARAIRLRLHFRNNFVVLSR